MYASAGRSLKDRSFKTAWKEIVEETNQIIYSPVCTNCPNSWLCHACIAMVYNECGNIGGYPDYLCRMNQAAAKYYQQYAAKLNLPEAEASDQREMDNYEDCELDGL